MPVGYTTSTWMKHLDARTNPELVKLLLEHDPKMISHIYNYNFDDVKGVVDQSISYLRRMSFLHATDHTELAKILNYAYSKKKAFRKQLINTLSHLTQGRSFWRSSIQGTFNMLDYADTLYSMFLYDPSYILVLNNDIITKVLEFKKKTFQDYLNELGSTEKYLNKAQKLIDKHKRGWRRETTNYRMLMEETVGYIYGESEICCNSIDEKIEALDKMIGEGEINPFSTILLFLKITD